MLKKILTNPLTVIGSIVVGVLAGVLYPHFSLQLESLGSIYLNLLKVVVLPFLLATILVGIVGLLQREGASQMIKKIIMGFVLSTLIAGVIGIGATVATRHEMSVEQRVTLGALISSKDQGDYEMTLAPIMKEAPRKDPLQGVLKFIPDNIFAALDGAESLKVVIFCLIFGISLGQMRGTGQASILDILRTVQGASIAIFKFLNYFLPFALIAMISSQVAKVGLAIFGVMVDYIMQQAVTGMVMWIVSTAALTWFARTNIMSVIRETRETLMLAISSRSALACIPYAQEALVRMRFQSSPVELMIPLSFTVNRIGSTAYYAVSTLFIANVYGVDLGLAGLATVLIGSMLAGLASAGSTGVLTVATTAVVCDLIGLPSEAMIVLLIAVDPVMDMIRTSTHVYGNLAVASFVCDKTETV